MFFLFTKLFQVPSFDFFYLWDTLLLDYSFNTFYLILITSVFAIIFGVMPAWFVSNYDFKLRNFFDLVLYLPLAIPTYIMSFTYSDLLSYTGPIQFFLRKNLPDAVSIFILPPSKQALLERLINRGQDDEITISKRMENSEKEMSHFNEFNYLIINDQFDSALSNLKAIIDDFRNNIKNIDLSLENQFLRHK